MNAVIYCRVSSERQAHEGHGLDGQERRCREYAKSYGYTVIQAFRDEGASGGTFVRPALQDMFSFMEKRKDIDMVLFEDVSRIARDMGVHIQILSKITQLGAKYQTVNQPIEDTAVGKFIVQSLANVAELHRNLNAQNVKHKMKARLESGHWTFDNPPGYVYQTVEGHGRLLVPDQPKAGVIQEALEGFASGRFQTQADVRDFLQSKGFKHRGKTTVVHPEQVRRILSRILYTGYIAYPKWGIKLVKGFHSPLISMATYDCIQQRLAGKDAMPHDRRDTRTDFPLRGFVLCAECGSPLTASWSTGRNARFAYYLCRKKGCSCYGKSIRRSVIEAQFEELLHTVQPNKPVLRLVERAMIDLWETRTLDFRSLLEQKKNRATEIEEKIQAYCDRIGETDSKSLIETYEQKIEELKAQKLRVGSNIKIDTAKLACFDFKKALRTVFEFIENPSEMWNDGSLSRRRLVLRFIFREPLLYERNVGFRTPTLSLPVEISCTCGQDYKSVVEMPGIEPGSNVVPRCSYCHAPLIFAPVGGERRNGARCDAKWTASPRHQAVTLSR